MLQTALRSLISPGNLWTLCSSIAEALAFLMSFIQEIYSHAGLTFGHSEKNPKFQKIYHLNLALMEDFSNFVCFSEWPLHSCHRTAVTVCLGSDEALRNCSGFIWTERLFHNFFNFIISFL